MHFFSKSVWTKLCFLTSHLFSFCPRTIKANHQILIIFIHHVYFSQASKTKSWICNKLQKYLLLDCSCNSNSFLYNQQQNFEPDTHQ
nr:hypothetical protein Iba_chr05dCG6680 [Ipomoea batatas]